MKWMDIESAPKDGTRILAWVGDVAVTVCWYGTIEAWVECVEFEYILSPTHWMPLPPPPQEGE